MNLPAELIEANRKRRAKGYLKMEDFRIDFASNVDRPAQELALGMFLKRNGTVGAADVLPSPKDGEDRTEFVKRFLAHEAAAQELPRVADRFACALAKVEQKGTLGEDDKPDKDVVFAQAGEDDEVEELDDEELGKEDVAELVTKVDTGAVTIKTKDGKALLTKATLPDGTFPIRNEDDLRKAITAVDAEGDHHRAARFHVVKRARDLGMADQLPDELVEIVTKATGPAGGASSNNQDKTMDPKNTTVEKKLADVTAKLEAQAADLKKAKAEATLTDAQRAHYSTLEGDAAEGFLGKSAEERQADVDNLAKGDPVVYTAKDGTEIRKSDGTLVLKMAKQLDTQAEELAKSRIAKAEEGFRKSAETVIAKFTGEMDEKVALMKAVSTITDEDLRGKVEKMLEVTNTAAAAMYKPIGKNSGDDAGTAAEQLTALAKARAKDKGEGFYEAYDAVSEANPELTRKAVQAG